MQRDEDYVRQASVLASFLNVQLASLSQLVCVVCFSPATEVLAMGVAIEVPKETDYS